MCKTRVEKTMVRFLAGICKIDSSEILQGVEADWRCMIWIIKSVHNWYGWPIRSGYTVNLVRRDDIKKSIETGKRNKVLLYFILIVRAFSTNTPFVLDPLMTFQYSIFFVMFVFILPWRQSRLNGQVWESLRQWLM